MTRLETLRLATSRAAEAKAAERAALVEDLLFLADMGVSWNEAARRVGYPNPAHLARRLTRHGHLNQISAAFDGAHLWRTA